MKLSSSIIALALVGSAKGFLAPSVKHSFAFKSSTALQEGKDVFSRFEGNHREPNENEMEIIDEMITKLSNAQPYELPRAVQTAFRVVSSPRFFMRVAERVDLATSDEEKEKLAELATNLVTTLEAVVSTADNTLDERAQDVELIVKAAAEPDSGEFMVPLIPARIEAMRTELENLDPNKLDEGFLSTVDSWTNKSHQDGMDGMVGILQKVLQQYAGISVSRARAVLQADDKASAAGDLFEHLLSVDSDTWEMEIKKGTAEGEVSTFGLIAEVQRTMERVVLNLENGSLAQRIQAEFLKEMVTRTEAIQE